MRAYFHPPNSLSLSRQNPDRCFLHDQPLSGRHSNPVLRDEEARNGAHAARASTPAPQGILEYGQEYHLGLPRLLRGALALFRAPAQPLEEAHGRHLEELPSKTSRRRRQWSFSASLVELLVSAVRQKARNRRVQDVGSFSSDNNSSSSSDYRNRADAFDDGGKWPGVQRLLGTEKRIACPKSPGWTSVEPIASGSTPYERHLRGKGTRPEPDGNGGH